MAYETIDVRPMAGALGAEVFGVDLTDLGDQTFTEIHRALLNHQLLYLDDQPLDDDRLETLTQRFGPLGITPFIEGILDHPDVIEVRKDADEVDTPNFGGRWHSDFSFQEAPPLDLAQRPPYPESWWRHALRRHVQRVRHAISWYEGGFGRAMCDA